jgi:GNAT superfamily N-acetyltransferase
MELSTDPDRLDIDLNHDFLASSYWAHGIPREVVVRSIEGALCFAAYDEGRQVAFARVISDRATFGYLSDVFVAESHRGRGLGRRLMEAVMTHPDLRTLRRWHLVTRDAHGLYRPFGFLPLARPEWHMEITHPDIYIASGAHGE